MRWLDARTVLLDPNAELAHDYEGCDVAPRGGAFGLAQPYGLAAAAPDEDEAARRSDGEDGASDEHDVAAPPRRRKKRKRREGDAAAALRALREAEAERRHEAALPSLDRALALLAAHLAATPPSPAAAAAEDVEDDGDDALAGLVAAAEDGMPLQLVPLSSEGWRSAPLVNTVHVHDSGAAAGRAALGDATFVLPPRCRFALGSAAHLPQLVPFLRGAGRGFRLIILDPPWEAVSIAALPVRLLCHPEGALVALWVTNRERVRRFVETELLPAWGLELAAEWRWLKVTAGGAPAVPLRGAGGGGARRPYEPLLLLRSAATSALPLPPLPQHVTLLAPPGAHSRKPRLQRLLRPLAAGCTDGPDDVAELFARELCAGGTAWGREPLRFQHTKLFVGC